ncbi:MAG: 30S ribosomal protein S11 [Gammaproteobacteria bacterium]|nr:30S ribosomal protein S11 [Gammaproteobacteria bacterium]MBU1558403.1 30S ribosomal protein S11 [Gammaproteobacteria bacterium]MBU2545993.1 30S ribosomal protein S11 [Gammaproteobacteria bacterium]
MAKAQTQKGKSGKTTKKRIKRQLPEGVLYVQATFNNTILTLTDPKGDVVAWNSAAAEGFRGSRKSTPFAAGEAAKKLALVAKEFGIRQVHVKVKGPGPGRESAVRAIEAGGIKVLSITDVTGIPHNGVRDPKKRRV